MERDDRLKEYKSKLSDSLLDLINLENLSISDLSRKTQIAYELLDNFVKQIYLPNVEISIKLANFFNCSLQFLFGWSSKRDFKQVKIVKNFYQNFLNILKQSNKSIYRVTVDLNLSRGITVKWKRGAYPRMSTVLLLAEYLGVMIDDLVCEK